MAAKDEFDRQDLKDPDQFFETVGVVNRYVTENRNQVIAGVVAVVALFVGIVSGVSYLNSARAQTAARFARALSNVADESPSAAKAGFQGVTEASGGPYGALSQLFVGRLEAEAGESAAAVAAFDRFLDSGSDEYLEQIALVGKAYALEMSDKKAEALAAYDEAAKLKGPYTAQALESRARLAEGSGDVAGAVAAIEELLKLGDPGIDDTLWNGKLEELRGGEGA